MAKFSSGKKGGQGKADRQTNSVCLTGRDTERNTWRERGGKREKKRTGERQKRWRERRGEKNSAKERWGEKEGDRADKQRKVDRERQPYKTDSGDGGRGWRQGT